MFGSTYSHDILRRTIVAFGTLFNDIHIIRKDASGKEQQSLKVPLAYGPKQKFLVRLRDDADLSNATALTLPRIGFELNGIEYDPERKLNKLAKVKKLKGTKGTQMESVYSPVPYNVNFELFVMSKNSDDGVQIIEQILPYFQPEYTVTLRAVDSLDIKRDVPIILNSISYEDNYEGDFDQRRALIYTMNFTCKFYLYGPVTSSNIIRTVQADQYTDMPDQSPKREQRYTVTPSPVSADADDDFGFNETTSFFTDAKNFNPVTGKDE